MSEQDLLQNPFSLESFCVTPAKMWMCHRVLHVCLCVRNLSTQRTHVWHKYHTLFRNFKVQNDKTSCQQQQTSQVLELFHSMTIYFHLKVYMYQSSTAISSQPVAFQTRAFSHYTPLTFDTPHIGN